MLARGIDELLALSPIINVRLAGRFSSLHSLEASRSKYLPKGLSIR
jgi:hypothetical protein